MTYKNVVIIGPQASGKGTQAKVLAKKLGISHVSSGDLFRAEIASGSQLGQQIKEIIDEGNLVPKELNDAIIRQALEAHPNGILLDGYPRTPEQAEFLDSQITVDLVLVLEVPDEICIERIGGRRVCPKGHGFHVEYKPPKQDGVCDIDGLPLKMRDDDKPEAVAKRLGIYHEQTVPVIKHYDAQGKVVRVDGKQSIDQVSRLIEDALSLN
ncbi:nucleoside monophosphate kinase [Candidatus Woesearchaeota archaeon]|nr:nucleoside monophosphate kinase [Candidatus Woesearchaeota archaeon]